MSKSNGATVACILDDDSRIPGRRFSLHVEYGGESEAHPLGAAATAAATAAVLVPQAAGFSVVVCDGRSHSVGPTVDGGGYDDGRAKTTVTLVNPNTLKTTTVTAPITITAR